MATPIKLRNGYLQPESDPNKKNGIIILTFMVATLIFVLLKIYVL